MDSKSLNGSSFPFAQCFVDRQQLVFGALPPTFRLSGQWPIEVRGETGGGGGVKQDPMNIQHVFLLAGNCGKGVLPQKYTSGEQLKVDLNS